MLTTPRQDPSRLNDGELFGYPVDSGTGSFMDRSTALLLSEAMRKTSGLLRNTNYRDGENLQKHLESARREIWRSKSPRIFLRLWRWGLRNLCWIRRRKCNSDGSHRFRSFAVGADKCHAGGLKVCPKEKWPGEALEFLARQKLTSKKATPTNCASYSHLQGKQSGFDVYMGTILSLNGGGTIRLGCRGTRGGTKLCGRGGNCPRPFVRRRSGDGSLALAPGWTSLLRCEGAGRCASSFPRGG